MPCAVIRQTTLIHCSTKTSTFAPFVVEIHVYNSNGVGTNFGVGVEEARPEGPKAGMGFLGGESQPLPPTRGMAGALQAPSTWSGAKGFLVF